MRLPKEYPSASDKHLIFTLEEEMRIQKNISRQTERTGDNLSKLDKINATRLAVIFVVLILLIVYLLYRCRQNSCTRKANIIQ